MPPLDLSQIEIRTERLPLRPFREEDLDRPAAMQALPEVARYLFWEPRGRPLGTRQEAPSARPNSATAPAPTKLVFAVLTSKWRRPHP